MSNPYPPNPYDPYSQPGGTYPQQSGDPYAQQYSQPPNYSQPAPQPVYVQPAYIQPVIVSQQTNGKATAAMILGLCVFIAWFLTGIPAVILGHMALNEIKASGGTQGGQGMAITGLVLGYLSIAGLACVCLLFLLGAFSSAATPT